MDLSKLPRLSKTEPPPPLPAEPASATEPSAPGQPLRRGAFCDQCGAGLRPRARFCDSCGAAVSATAGPASDVLPYRPEEERPGAGPEAWIGIALGVIILFLSPRLLQYVFAPASFPSKYTFFDESGQPLAYTKSVFFWGDLAITAFAAVLILEGVVIAFARKPVPVLIAFVLTVAATLLNLWYVAMMFNKGYGFQILAGIAVAFGVYIAIYQWSLFQALRTFRGPGRVR